MRKLCVLLLRFYQRAISPWIGPHCRFTPTCSQYAIEAIQRHGVIKGGAYTAWRVMRCHPFCRGGHDPVP